MRDSLDVWVYFWSCMRVNNVKQHNISKVFHILKTWNNTLNFFPIIWPPKSEKVWLWHQSLTSDLSSDRSTWTCRCPSSSTRPPVRTPTAPAPQGTTPCSPTTRCLTSPVFPNSFPVTGWLGHKTCAGGGRTLTSSHSLWQKYHRSLTQAPQDTERDKKEKKENSACNTSTVLQLFLICLKLSDKALFRVFFFSSSPRTLFKHWRIFFSCRWTMFVFFFSEMKLYFCTRASLLLQTICGVKPFRAYWD